VRAAAQLARETGHAEIAAWCLETQAWQLLTAGDYRRAADMSPALLSEEFEGFLDEFEHKMLT
jgi:hypothetical protein